MDTKMATRTVGAQGANEFIEITLAQYLDNLESHLQADCLTYVGPLLSGADDGRRFLNPKPRHVCRDYSRDVRGRYPHGLLFRVGTD